MLRKIPFWTLPFIQSILFVILIWLGCPYRPTWEAWMRRPSIDRDNNGLGMVFEYIDYYLTPYPEQLAVGLNFPAAVAGGSVGMMVGSIYDAVAKEQLSGARRELLYHGLTAICVPFLWIFVWRANPRSRKGDEPSLSLLTKIGIATALVLLWIFAVLCCANVVWGVISMFSYGWQAFDLQSVLSLAWVVIGIRILTPKFRNRQGRVPKATEA